jgi:predicted sulfurtransferase
MALKQSWTIIAFLVVFVLAGCLQNVALDTKTPRMTKEELKPLLDNPEVIILDVRLLDEWKRGDLKIKGAVREDPEKDYRTWASKYSKDKTLVFYCS